MSYEWWGTDRWDNARVLQLIVLDSSLSWLLPACVSSFSHYHLNQYLSYGTCKPRNIVSLFTRAMTEASFRKRLRLPLSFVAKALAESCWIRPFYWKKMPPQPRSTTQMPMTVLHPPFWRMPSRCYNLTVPNFNKNRVVNILWHISTTTVPRGGAVFPSHMVAASQLRMYSVPSWQHVLFCFSFFPCVGHHSR